MVVTKEQLLEAYSADKIEPCKKPDTYYLNVNSKLFRTVGPFEYSENCKYPEESLNIPTVNKIKYSFSNKIICPGLFYSIYCTTVKTKEYWRHN